MNLLEKNGTERKNKANNWILAEDNQRRRNVAKILLWVGV